MSITIANTTSTDTFSAWLGRMNEVTHAMSTYVMTANSTLGSVTGNSRLFGIFSSNTIVAEDGLRGGNNTTSNTLIISSNVNMQSHASVGNTLTVTGRADLNGGTNTTTMNVSTSIAVGNTLTINTTTFFVGNSSSNAYMKQGEIVVGNVSINSTHLTVGSTTVNSSTLGESSNNANYLQGKQWENPNEIGGVTANNATFKTVAMEKISANGGVGTAGEILKSDGSGNLYWETGGEGYSGSKGYSGSVGFTGSVGYTGSRGSTGFSGSRGYSGSVGSAGTPGDQGYSGSKGDDGSPGGLGFSGSVGAAGTGFTGSKGDIGFSGSGGSALNGYTGSRGYSGSVGFTGSIGAAGTWSGIATGDVDFENSYDMDRVKSLGVGTFASGSTGEIRATGNITAYYSDQRLKNRLGPILNALTKVKSLNGFYFTPNEEAKRLGYDHNVEDVGVSAQEVMAILPQIVAPAPINDEFGTDYITVRYEKLIPLLIEAIKELSEMIERGIK